jgi:tryptophan synthase
LYSANQNRRLSYIPLIASSTPNEHIEILCNIADSFVYIVTQTGVSGTYEKPYECVGDLLYRVHACTGNPVPVAVGFGIGTQQNFVDIARLTEGIVIGSPIISILGNATLGTGAQKVKEYCLQVAGRTEDQVVITERKDQATQPLSPTTIYLSYDGAGDTLEHTGVQSPRCP